MSNIPAEAVEAVALALFTDDARDDDELNWTDHYFEYRRRALHALEAAAPHMLKSAYDLGLQHGANQPANPYMRDTEGEK